MRYLSKIFFFRHHYLLSKEDENTINKEDIVYCKGNKGDFISLIQKHGIAADL